MPLVPTLQATPSVQGGTQEVACLVFSFSVCLLTFKVRCERIVAKGKETVSDEHRQTQNVSCPSLILCSTSKLCLLTLSSLRIQAFLVHSLGQYLLPVFHMPATPQGTGNRIMSGERCGACLLHGACHLQSRQPFI